jgi:hypothetical protein
MNPKEITSEILKDISKIEKSSTQRLLKEYDRESKKFKIDKTKSYPKVFEIKKAAKNTWLIFLRKSPTEKNISIFIPLLLVAWSISMIVLV